MKYLSLVIYDEKKLEAISSLSWQAKKPAHSGKALNGTAWIAELRLETDSNRQNCKHFHIQHFPD
jgi:hypothetical protein